MAIAVAECDEEWLGKAEARSAVIA